MHKPTRKEKISSEIGECRGHLREVASLLAEGASERLGPRIDSAKDKVSPTVDKARGAALHGLESMTIALGGKPQKSRKWPMLIGALGIGLVAGVVGALIVQRNQSRWDEYEPVQVLGMDEPMETMKSTARDMGDKMHEAGDKVREAASNAKSTARQVTNDAKGAARGAASEVKQGAKNAARHVSESTNSEATKKTPRKSS